MKQNSISMSFTGMDSWTILSPIEQIIKRKIETTGTPLKEWDISINRGILTGFNEAFIISGEKKDELIAADPKSAEIIRPILRGRDVKRYSFEFQNTYLITTHNGYTSAEGKVIPPVDIDEYPVIKAHLGNYWDLISVRRDKGVTPYNLRNCAYMDDFSKQKIVWARLMRISKNDNANFPRFALVDENYYVQDSLCLLTGDQLPLICAVLNSDMGIFQYFTKIATLDDGGLQMRQQYIEIFPMPMLDGNDAVQEEILSLLIAQNDFNDPNFREQMNQLVFRLYDLTANEITYIRKLIKARFDAINSR